jgi:hypothetical protein
VRRGRNILGRGPSAVTRVERDRTEVPTPAGRWCGSRPTTSSSTTGPNPHRRAFQTMLRAAAPFEVTGTQPVMKTTGGQRLFSTTLLADELTNAMISGNELGAKLDGTTTEPQRSRVPAHLVAAPTTTTVDHYLRWEALAGTSSPRTPRTELSVEAVATKLRPLQRRRLPPAGH